MADNNRKELVDQHLSIVEKHTDNWSNGSLAAHTMEGKLKVAELIIDMTRIEVRAAREELAKV